MAIQQSKNDQRKRRAARVRAKISGTAACPRISVFRSLHGVSVQAIDDESGLTIASASYHDMKKPFDKNTVEQAREIGKAIGVRCLEKGVQQAVFDRSGYAYHGKVQAVAEGVRESGVMM